MKTGFHTIKMFGILAEKTGQHVLTVPLMADTDQLTAWLFERYPQLEGIKFTLAVNKQLIHNNTPLDEGVEVALLPPYSGG
jgi:molybdopterin synthase sulfur carrier subunit